MPSFTTRARAVASAPGRLKSPASQPSPRTRRRQPAACQPGRARRLLTERPQHALPACRVVIRRVEAADGVRRGVDALTRPLAPLVEGVAVNPRLDLGVRSSSKDRVEEIDEVLDVAGGGLVFPCSQAQPDVLLAPQELVDAQSRAIRLFEAQRISRRLRKPGVHHQPARRHQRQQRILVHRQLVLATREEPQTVAEPVRLHARQQLDALVAERLGRVAPRIVFTAVATRGHDRADAFVERRRERAPASRCASARPVRSAPC